MSGEVTSLPWAVVQFGGMQIGNATGEAICTMWDQPGKGAANAALIVRAVNCHDELVEALQSLFDDYKDLADCGDAGFWQLEETEVGKKALAALSRARSEVTP